VVAVDSSLELRLKKLMAFRLVMVTTLLLIASYLEAVSENLLPVNPLYFLIAATYVLTVFHALALRFLTALTPQVYSQVVSDLLIITGLVYTTGGVRAGFILLYPISVLSGSVLLLSRRGGLLLALLATLFYASTLWAVRLGLVPPQGLSDVFLLSAKALFYSIFVTGVACGTVALIGSYLAESLRHAGEKLEEAVEEVADLRGLNEVIVNSIHSGLLTVDGGGRILHVNTFGEDVLGRRRGEIRGRLIREILGSWFFDPPALQARAADRKLARLQFDYERPDGTTCVLGVSVSPLSQGGRASGGYLLVFQDLTEIKRLEQEARINEKLAAVGEMAAQLAHEIRNPLGSISGSAQVLLADSGFSPEQERLLSIITRESKRLSDALNQFLYQAKSSSERSGPVDIRSVVAEAVTLLRNGPEVGLERVVEFVSDNGPLLCLADRDQIAQVFWNLARNGLEAMPEGGVLKVTLRRTEDEVVLSVRDQGRGMGREEQRRLFQPFQSGSRVGTGLGLAIVYRIVREHGGDIVVRSYPSLGTEVEVRLPLVSATVQA
jgi:two-component system sensor histidine kinase PilS (NtrC family)